MSSVLKLQPGAFSGLAADTAGVPWRDNRIEAGSAYREAPVCSGFSLLAAIAAW